MKISDRELTIAALAAAVILVGGTYLLAESKIQEWGAMARERRSLAERILLSERLVGQRAERDRELAAMRTALPRFPVGKDVTTELLRTVEQFSRESNLTLLRRDPDEERRAGYLYETALNCTWEGGLEALTHYLFALQTHGGMLDVRKLSVTPVVRGGGKQLRGQFTVDYAYTREGGGAATNAPAAVPPADTRVKK